MKNKTMAAVLKFLLIIGLVFAGLIGFGIYYLFFDMNRLPTGEFVTEEVSPDGTYTVKIYFVAGGATTPNMTRGELVFNDQDKKPKTIFWDKEQKSTTIEWSEADTVVINDRTLEVPRERYDFRND